MENVTEFLRSKGLAHTDLIYNFLKMERVKYLIASGEKVVASPGKYGGTSFRNVQKTNYYGLLMHHEPRA